jgi:hypothetical protein
MTGDRGQETGDRSQGSGDELGDESWAALGALLFIGASLRGVLSRCNLNNLHNRMACGS